MSKNVAEREIGHDRQACAICVLKPKSPSLCPKPRSRESPTLMSSPQTHQAHVSSPGITVTAPIRTARRVYARQPLSVGR
jgi:hypothetical protein